MYPKIVTQFLNVPITVVCSFHVLERPLTVLSNNLWTFYIALYKRREKVKSKSSSAICFLQRQMLNNAFHLSTL